MLSPLLRGTGCVLFETAAGANTGRVLPVKGCHLLIAEVTYIAMPHPLANIVKLTPVMMDACCTHSNVVNSGVRLLDQLKLTKFLHKFHSHFGVIF